MDLSTVGGRVHSSLCVEVGEIVVVVERLAVNDGANGGNDGSFDTLCGAVQTQVELARHLRNVSNFCCRN